MEFCSLSKGSLAWSHMWFVVFLFVYCILLLPVFALFKIKLPQRLKEKLGNILANPVCTFALFVPLMIYYYTLYLPFPEQMSMLNDWSLFISSLTFLLYGYFLGGNTKFWATKNTDSGMPAFPQYAL
jgi:glucan biosynthesis protein C